MCHPATVDSISTSAAQEDHVSMGTFAALKSLRVMENVERVLGIELMCACQALDLTVEEKFTRNFRVNREMREKNYVYNPFLDKFRAKSSSKCKIELCQNFKFWCMKSKFKFGNRFLKFKTKLHKFDLPIPLESDLET